LAGSFYADPVYEILCELTNSRKKFLAGILAKEFVRENVSLNFAQKNAVAFFCAKMCVLNKQRRSLHIPMMGNQEDLLVTTKRKGPKNI
jgi:hypothetical protein